MGHLPLTKGPHHKDGEALTINIEQRSAHASVQVEEVLEMFAHQVETPQLRKESSLGVEELQDLQSKPVHYDPHII
jgi:hypothetical protein